MTIDSKATTEDYSHINHVISNIDSNNDHAIVIGGVNSGKTTLALELAATHKDRKVQVLCASNAIAKHTRNNYIDALSMSDDEHAVNNTVNNVKFSSVSTYAYSLVNAATDGEGEPVKMLTASEQHNMLSEVIGEYAKESANTLDDLTRKTILTEQFQTELHGAIDLFGRDKSYKQYITNLAEKYPFWPICEKIYEKYVQKRNISGKYDQNSIIIAATKLITDGKANDIVDYIIVDDAQELNILEMRLLNAIAQNATKTAKTATQTANDADSGTKIVFDDNGACRPRNKCGDGAMVDVGTKIVLIGNPEQTMQTYRGALGNFDKFFESDNCQTYLLDDKRTSKPNPEYHQMGDFANQISYIISDIRDKYLKSSYKYSDFAIIASSSTALHSSLSILNKHGIPVNYKSPLTPIKNEKVWQNIVDYILSTDDLITKLPTQAVWEAWENIKPKDSSIDMAIVEGSSYTNRLLDTAIFIIDQAKAYEKEALGKHRVAKAEDFINHIESQDLGVDVLPPKTVIDSVSLLTPMQAAGLHFKTVYIIEVQESVWPNLKVRSPLIKTHILQKLLYGEIETDTEFSETEYYKELISSEESLLLNSIARATDNVHIFAELNENTFPSEFFGSDNDEIETAPPILTIDEQIVLRRNQLAQSMISKTLAIESQSSESANDSGLRGVSAELTYRELNYLQKTKISRLNTSTWYYNNSVKNNDTIAVSASAELKKLPDVHISPSNVEALYNCPLKWFYELNGATIPSGISAQLGTVIHRVAELVPELVDSEAQTLFSAVHSGDKNEVQSLLEDHANKTPDDIKDVNTDMNSKDCDPTFRELYKQYNILVGENRKDSSGETCEMADFAAELSKMSPFERQRTHAKVELLLRNILLYYRTITYGADGMIRVVAKDAKGKALNEQNYTVDISPTETKQKVTLGGRIDRLESIVARKVGDVWEINQELLENEKGGGAGNDQKYYIVDWKTGAPPSTPKEVDDPLDSVNLQILSYQIILDRCDAKIKPAGGCLVYLNKKLGPRTYVNSYVKTQDSIDTLDCIDEELINYIRKTVSMNEYIASTKKDLCRYCKLTSSCPIKDEGLRVGEND